jgi:hypothetical protein
METMKFDDAVIRERQVSIGEQVYLLKEATGEAVAKYRDAQLRATKLNKEADVVQLGDVAESELLLLSLCLWEAQTHGGKYLPKQSVSLDTVKAWPSRITTPLFTELERMSGLNAHARGQAKNLQNGSTDGSV